MNPPSLIDVCRFLRRHGPGFKNCSTKNLAHFVAWYWRDARVGVVHDAGRVVAVALARCIKDVAEAETPYVHTETALLVWVDDIVSQHPAGVQLLLAHALQRFGPRHAFAGHVFSRSGELRMLPFRTVQRLAA